MEEPDENVTFEFMKQIILSVTNDLATDQRVHRHATSLMKLGAHVTLVGRLLPDSQPLQRDYAIHRMKLLFKRSSLFYAEYNIRLFFYLLFKKVDILVSNDLDTLLANYLVSVIRRKTLVYDSHEYFTEVPELINRKIAKFVWITLECWILPKIKHAYTVSQSIANAYFEKYHIRMIVVRNLPIRLNPGNQRKPYPGLPTSKFVLYQGAVNKGRGLEALVDSFEYINEVKCVIVGGGDIQKTLAERITNKNLQDKVILLGKLPFFELERITPHADLGISIEENTGLSYSYALPNKLFDYIQAEIPVLCSNLVEVTSVVKSWKVGAIIENHNPLEIAEKINEILKNDQQLQIWKRNLAKAAQELCWEKEEGNLIEVYRKLF